MRPLWSLFRREFSSYFLSPVAYVALAVFLLVTGAQFARVMASLTESGPRGVEYPMQGLLGEERFWVVFLLIPPLLTMRLLAEERGTGTLEALLTAPIRDWQVVAGKYLGSLAFYVVLWLPTLVYVPVLVDFDWQTYHPRVDPWPVLTTYVGFLAVGAMFLAIGLYVSSLVKTQLVAALLAMAVGLVFLVAGFTQADPDASSTWSRVYDFVSVPKHFRRDFFRGVIDTRHLVLYASVTGFCLFLTALSLEQRRLRA